MIRNRTQLNFLTEVITPVDSSSRRSYWAMQYCSVLETLYFQNNLEFSMSKNCPDGVIPTLGLFKGNAHVVNFFQKIKSNVVNHAMQYFLNHYLFNHGQFLLRELIDCLDKKFNLDRHIEKQDVIFGFVVGKDSLILKPDFKGFEVFVPFENGKFIKLSEILEEVSSSDMLIVLKTMPKTGGPHLKTYAFFCEVEGNNGQEMFRNGYSLKSNKGKYRHVYFSVSDRKQKIDGNPIKERITINNVSSSVNDVILVHFSESHDIILDYKKAIQDFHCLLSLNADSVQIDEKNPLNQGRKDIVNLIQTYWNKPAIELIMILRDMVKPIDISSERVGLAKQRHYSENRSQLYDVTRVFEPSESNHLTLTIPEFITNSSGMLIDKVN